MPNQDEELRKILEDLCQSNPTIVGPIEYAIASIKQWAKNKIGEDMRVGIYFPKDEFVSGYNQRALEIRQRIEKDR